MGKIRIGILGTGTISESHIRAYRNNPKAEIVAICDTNEARLNEIGQKYNISKRYASAKELLANEKLDAVSVCSFPCNHVELALLAVEKGLNVLVEKPLGTSYNDTQKLSEKVLQNGKVGMVGMTHRYRNDVKVLKAVLDGGQVGNIKHINARLVSRRGVPVGFFTDKAYAGGGALFDVGVHLLDLAWYLAGTPEPETVSGHTIQSVGPINTLTINRWRSSNPYNQDQSVFDVDDLSVALIRFKNGMSMTFEIAWAVNGPATDGINVDILGDKGGVSLNPLAYYTEKNDVLMDAKLTYSNNDWFQTEINHYLDCVEKQVEPLSPIRQGSTVVQMLEAIAVSSDRNREIVLPL
ncbi:MAG: Gfo/Idh/MocA family oxidoreductase [Firmicutes bacterium]|nr:Gfo/Idh/MocA family oxidoreductase [Bacillota bacterium]MDD4693648.1 Gfo/Idh/MocA family oxidoreductase [Bacillota bacterium]